MRTMNSTLRIALFSHDSLGLGHIRRNRALAFAMAKSLPALTGRRVSGLLIAGNPEATRFDLPAGWDWVILPGVTPAAGGYQPRALASSMEGLSSLRKAAIEAILDQQDPELFIVDRHPFGIDGELREALRHVRARGCRTVLGLREVLDSPKVIEREWNRVGGPGAVADSFDAVWIYGDPDVYDPRTTGEVPTELARIAECTGYLAMERPDDRATTTPGRFVLTCLGGGSDGAELASIAVRSQPPAGYNHLVVTGPQMDFADFEALKRTAAKETTVIRHSDDIPGLIASASAVVCMGGYNTLSEVMATATPALVVPRNSHRAEQPRRAEALAAVGAVDTCAFSEVSVAALNDWFGDRVGHSIDRSNVDLAGLQTIAHLAAELIGTDAETIGTDSAAASRGSITWIKEIRYAG